jgi:hypothetical protein
MGASIASSHHSFTSYSWFERDHRVSRAIEKNLDVFMSDVGKCFI